ncbi:MAG: Methyltransferase type 11 [Bryobacterales bacterium]|nr:Methyltransferase type 11 [Bryobacterales bacterium]
MNAVGFDTLASRYDQLWTYSAAGRGQRRAVWSCADTLFQAGDRILDVGCGTGRDALHFIRAGIGVEAIDSSVEMVGIARKRGIDASVLSAENLDALEGPFDGIFSNFGALNCVADLPALRASFARLIPPGGHLVICLLGRVCAWETIWYLLHARPGKAFRRWSGESRSASLGLRIAYPRARVLQRGFAPDFELMSWCGIGLAVPPSYAPRLPRSAVRLLAMLDRHLAHRRGLRALADHRLFVFARK